MAEYHVGCGAFAIYAGTLEPRNKKLWRNKTDCTEEAIAAVQDYMVEQCLGGFDCRKAKSGGWEGKLKDGRVVQLMVEIKGGSVMENFSRKERRVIEKYEAGAGFREIHNSLGVGQAETMRVIGRYRRARRAEEESACRHCEWRINGNTFCALPKCFLKSAPGCGKMVGTI